MIFSLSRPFLSGHFRCRTLIRLINNQTTLGPNFDVNYENDQSNLQRNVPKTNNDFEKLRRIPIQQPDDARLLRVSIVGCPNAGKSTLLNNLIHWKISSVSSKVHTTRKNVIGVFCQDNCQIEFVDTPGLVSKKHIIRHKLEVSFVNDLKNSIENADMLAILTDVSNLRERHRLNSGILDLLKRINHTKKSVLILNKVDKIKDKRSLLDVVVNLTMGIVDGEPISSIDNEEEELLKFELKQGKFDTLFKRTEKHYFNYEDKQKKDNKPGLEDLKTGWPYFSRVFMISALYNDGIDELRSYFLEQAKPKEWIYNGQTVTIHNPKRLIIDSIIEVCLETFKHEIPYNLRAEIVMWETDDLGNLYLVIDLFIIEKFLSLLIGPKGMTISTIVKKSRESLANIFRCDVSLKIAAKPSR